MSYKTEAKLMKVLDYICDYSDEKGFPPTVREIGKELGIGSTATVSYYLTKLADGGFIKKADFKNRCLEVIYNPNRPSRLGIPVVGKVAAGLPITAIENIDDYVSLPSNIFNTNDDLFILNVTGESMINAGIYDGDKIIVRKQSDAKNGDKVIALIDDSATVKTFYKENGHIRLQPENDTMEPIIVPDCQILGIVVGLIRKY
ncbi:MAG: transcriptional repressor LexA [bacterium]|nr:transcriptional repressor LexA [bacterium]